MSTDCNVRIDDKYISMNRWYIFGSVIRSKEIMSKSEALKKITVLESNVENETTVWGDRQEEKIKYHDHWLGEARKEILKANENSNVTFFSEHDIPESKYDLQNVENYANGKADQLKNRLEELRKDMLEKLGGSIQSKDMDKTPTLEQWLRYWLHRTGFDKAVVNSIQMKMDLVKRPNRFDDNDKVSNKV